MTDSQPNADSPSPKPRGLWSLMGAAPSAADPPSAPPDPPEQTKTLSEIESASDESDKLRELSKRRGLWTLMRSGPAPEAHGAHDESSDSGSQTSSDPDLSVPQNEQASSHTGKGLFATMRRSVQVDEATPSEIDDLIEELDQDHSFANVPSSDGEEDLSAAVAVQAFDTDDSDDAGVEEQFESSLREAVRSEEALDLLDLEPPSFLPLGEKARRQCWMSLAWGGVSVAASALAMLPQFWSSAPATLLGFTAIITAYLPLSGSVRREIPSSARGASLMGMLLGTLGVLLGPLLFAGLGRNLRESTGSLATSRHLTQMSGAMNRYYAENDAFPIGGTFARNEAGVIRGQHGWMTFLLPFIGEAELFHQIDKSKPFDDPVNRVPMGRDVIVYFAAGGDRARIGQGFSVSHFAGIGGEIDGASGLSHLGVFERDVAIKREEITDGLSTTMIVGELPGGYPPWGDPENWRKIGRGLNKDPNGFGSANGHGASFLFADGSVRFFSNKTDPKVLQALSTRDGSE